MSRSSARLSGASGARSTRASGRSPAATRRAGDRSPVRWWRRRWCSIPAHPARPQRFQEARCGEREKLYEKICATAQVAVAFGSVARIDRDNILRASLWALARAVRALPVDAAARLRRRQHRRSTAAATARRWCRATRWCFDRGGLDRRQGHPRPADEPARPGASRLRLRAPHGLFACPSISRRWPASGRPSITAGPLRRWRPSSRRWAAACRRGHRRVVASLVRLLYLWPSSYSPAPGQCITSP